MGPLEIACSVGGDEIVKHLVEKKCAVTSKAFLNYTKHSIKEKKKFHVPTVTPEQESQQKRAEEQKQQAMKQLLKDREDEIENLKKDIKRLQRENGRMKN